jgi:hypothetical protein
MKTTYSYVTLRYVHDVVTGEFANVGVVLYSPEQRFIEARFSASYERLNAIFLKIDHAHFRHLIRYLSNRFAELSEEIGESLDLLPVTGIKELVRRVLPPDDSSLQWSEAGGGFTADPKTTLQQLYSRLVERYVKGSEVPSRSDEDIAKPFKARLEKKKVAQRVEEKRIDAKDYQYTFDYGWKNSIWHLYQPVSFDLLNPSSIVEKANTWLGRGTALNDSEEQFKVYFLLGEPKSPEGRKAFVHARHILEKIPAKKKLIPENEIENFADEIAEEISEHEGILGDSRR